MTIRTTIRTIAAASAIVTLSAVLALAAAKTGELSLNVLGKLGAASREEAVTLGRAAGLGRGGREVPGGHRPDPPR